MPPLVLDEMKLQHTGTPPRFVVPLRGFRSRIPGDLGLLPTCAYAQDASFCFAAVESDWFAGFPAAAVAGEVAGLTRTEHLLPMSRGSANWPAVRF